MTATTDRILADNVSLFLARTLLIPKAQPDVLLVQVGSDGNLDAGAAQASSGRSQIRIFKLADIDKGSKVYTSGSLLGYGIRNNAAIAEDGHGGIVSDVYCHQIRVRILTRGSSPSITEWMTCM